MKKTIKNHFNRILEILKDSDYLIEKIENMSLFLRKRISNNNKIFVCGNGGSFADASHFVGELTATYSKKNRKPLPFILLGSNQAAVTAWSNDYNFEDYLTREFSALYNKNDVFYNYL